MLARQRRGIAAFRTTPKHSIQWDEVPLGQCVDEHLADMLGCSKGLVYKERTRRRIPPYGMTYRTVENEGAYYEEAIVDAWLHKKGIQHEFQKKLGPYRVDWLLADNVVWEYLGMWRHQLYGETYRKNFGVKRAFLESEGFTVRAIHRAEIQDFKSTVDLKALLSMGLFECRGCGRKDVKHHAHALCAGCLTRQQKGIPFGPMSVKLRPEDPFVCASCGSEDRRKRVRGNCGRCASKSYKTKLILSGV